ncbi:MAG: lysophospholipid acyltransferase family protein [Lachnospiraceae bacterium]
MKRICLMVFTLFFKAIYYFVRIWIHGKRKCVDYIEGFFLVKKVTIDANRAGRVKIEVQGVENIPKQDGFIFYPNHQGLFDVLAFIESSPRPFAFVIKKEASNIILLKQVMAALGSIAIDREDIKQSMGVINQVAKEVSKGRNFLIFAEGTRSKEGNKLGEFKGGSFKSATKVGCPIVPCAIIDAFIPFDKNEINPVTVKVIYLKPIYYNEYKDMKTVEIASLVKSRIEDAIKKVIDKVE